MDGNMWPALWWRSLCDRHDWVGTPGQRTVMAAKYLVRAIGLAGRHQGFLATFYKHPLLRACVQRDPRLLERHLHRFINRHWHRAKRLRSIQSHYRHLLRRWPAELFEAVYVKGRATLGDLTLKDGSQLLVRLRPPIAMGCEGELAIELCEASGRTLYRLVITITDDKQTTMAIGCIQGPDGDDARDQVRELTRNMHGMRPKQLLLVLAYAFAGQCGIQRILAVGNDAHPLHGRTRFMADYDAFWLEQGGVASAQGWFELPETLHHRTEAEVPSRHRSTFRRRAELRWQAVQLLNNAMGPMPWWQDTGTMDAALESEPALPVVLKEASWIS
ncbi:VirK/YbjX family protein [Dyella sp. 20L07]|uniref:VirK/YbjX family protein n=1 Tax=Dyella sp. 20L07 TaxID=3384240 RepID=UPI003D26D941